MDTNYNEEMDYILSQLIVEYENMYKGVTFYTEDISMTTKDIITEKVKNKFNLKDWEINVLFYTLLIDKHVKSVEPLTISLEGLVFRNNGGYTEKKIQEEKEKLRILNMENDFNRYSFLLMIFTAIVALGTMISAFYFCIEIWKHYSK